LFRHISLFSNISSSHSYVWIVPYPRSSFAISIFQHRLNERRHNAFLMGLRGSGLSKFSNFSLKRIARKISGVRVYGLCHLKPHYLGHSSMYILSLKAAELVLNMRLNRPTQPQSRWHFASRGVLLNYSWASWAMTPNRQDRG